MLKALDLDTSRVRAVSPQGLDAYAAARPATNDATYSPSYTITAGVAVLPIVGELTQYATDTSVGYDAIKLSFLRALRDPKAKAIALVVDSFGGDIAGLFDLVDEIYSARAVKPTLAICSETAYSAAYAIASACEQVTVPRTGGVGSVGVIAEHVDRSGQLDQAGVKITLIHHGSHKADGTEVRPLSADARERMQAEIDAMGRLFVATVARNRGMSPAAVAATQAGTFMGIKAVQAGFANAVMSPDDAFLDLASQLQAA